MGQLSSKLRSVVGGGLTYWCQGCEEAHSVNSGWAYNGNPEAPTFSPSVLVTSGHYTSSWTAEKPCWCTYNRDNPKRPAPFKCHRCHTFINDGMVQFLGDCSHALAGQTLPLPDLPESMQDRESAA